VCFNFSVLNVKLDLFHATCYTKIMLNVFPTNSEHSSLPGSNAPVYFVKNTAPKSFVASVPGLVRGDGGALDADVELLDGVGAIDRNLLIFFVVKNYELSFNYVR
jgi:hypothetical protein